MRKQTWPQALRLCGWTLAIAALAGCQATIGSSLDPNRTPRTGALSGAPYSLPKVTAHVSLAQTADGVMLTVGPPVYGPDPARSYLLRYQPSATAKDKFDISVDADTGLLTSINGEAVDQTGDILVALAGAAGAFGPMGRGFRTEADVTPAKPIIIVETDIDPADPLSLAEAAQDMNAALQRHYQPSMSRNCDTAAEAAASALPAKARKDPRKMFEARTKASAAAPACQALAKLKATRLEISVNYKAFAFDPGVTPASCEIGICTRVIQPARIRLLDGAVPIASRVFNMPNGSAPVALDLSRATFVKAGHKVALHNGLLAKTDRTKDSEALAIANTPVAMARALVSIPTELVQLRVNYTNQDKALTTARGQVLDAERARVIAEEKLRVALKDPAAAAAAGVGTTPPAASDPAGAAESATEPAAGADTATTPAVGDVVQPTTPLLQVVIPGLGAASGFELAAVAGLANNSENSGAGATNAAKPGKPAKPAKPGADADPTGPETIEGGDGAKKK